jgi:hypothetical protein
MACWCCLRFYFSSPVPLQDICFWCFQQPCWLWRLAIQIIRGRGAVLYRFVLRPHCGALPSALTANRLKLHPSFRSFLLRQKLKTAFTKKKSKVVCFTKRVAKRQSDYCVLKTAFKTICSIVCQEAVARCPLPIILCRCTNNSVIQRYFNCLCYTLTNGLKHRPVPECFKHLGCSCHTLCPLPVLWPAHLSHIVPAASVVAGSDMDALRVATLAAWGFCSVGDEYEHGCVLVSWPTI